MFSIPLTRKPGKHALTFIFITVLLDVIGFGIIIPVLPGLVMELTGQEVSGAALYGGGLLFIYALMQFFFAPLIGNLSDYWGRRPILLISLIVLSVDYLVMGFAPTIIWLFAGRMIAGIAGATYATANAFIADVTPEEKRAQSFGMIGAAFGLGFIIGPSLGGILGEFGLRIPFFFASGLAFANFIYGFLVLPETLPEEKRRPFRFARANPIGAFRALRHYPIVIGLMGCVFIYQVAHDANPSTWSYFTIFQFDWSPGQIGMSLAFVGFCLALVQGVLIRYVIPLFGEKKTVYIGLSFASIGFLGFAFSTSAWMLYMWIVPFSLMGLIMPALRSIMSSSVPENAQGELAGAISSVASLTAIFSPLLMTQAFGYFTSGKAPFEFAGISFFFASVLCCVAIGAFGLVVRGFGLPERSI